MKGSLCFPDYSRLCAKPLFLMMLAALAACTDNSVIYERDGEVAERGAIQLQEVKVVSETDDRLTLGFTYTYDHEIPVEEVKLFVMPDHGYWQTRDVAVSPGTNTAQVSIGLSRRNMDKDDVTESDTSILRFRFEHYRPKKYLGNIWGVDVPYEKHWTLDADS